MPWTELDDETGVPEYRIIGKATEAAIGFGSLVTAPEDFSAAAGYWDLNTRCTIGGSATMPDGSVGTTNGVIASVDDSTHYIQELFAAGELADDTSYTFSVYAKAGAKNWLLITPCTKANVWKQTYFDLANGVLGATKSTDDEGIESVGNGWYRCWITQDFGSGATTPVLALYLSEADGDSSFQGDGSTVTTYLWGAMLTEGTAPVPYLPLYSNGNYRIVLHDSSGYEAKGWIGEADAAEALGGELVTNGDFTAWTADDPDGWAVTGESGAGQQITESGGGGQCVIESDGTYIDIAQGNILPSTDSNLYKVAYDQVAVDSGSIKFNIGGHQVVPGTSIATLTFYRTSPGTNKNLTFARNAACDVTIDNVTVKNVTAIGLDAVHIYLDKDKTTQSWAVHSSFDWNDISAMEIEEYTAPPIGTPLRLDNASPGTQIVGPLKITMIQWIDENGLVEDGMPLAFKINGIEITVTNNLGSDIGQQGNVLYQAGPFKFPIQTNADGFELTTGAASAGGVLIYCK